MKLSAAVKQYEECMENSGPCLVKNCPLYKSITISIGSPDDQFGEIKWKVEGCALVGLLEEWLKNKKPGEPYEDE